MTVLATMGTRSCATIAIGWFKSTKVKKPNAIYDWDCYTQAEWNEAYRNGEIKFNVPEKGMSVGAFYDEIIFPTEQELGETGEYPFDALMDAIDISELQSKFIIASLNEHQFFLNDSYWPKRLKARGFELIEKTNNSIGDMNYIFKRDRNQRELTEEELSIMSDEEQVLEEAV